ncbi:BlaI/MecI/CopY family transcriptional regulator [Flavobacterium pedocola]
MQLTKAEEQIMHYLWELEKAYMKDLLEVFPEPKPATTTVATLLKRMTDKGFISYTEFGKSREYFPLIRKEDYSKKEVTNFIKDFFNNSSAQFASFFTKETDMTATELEELQKIIEKELQKKRK